MGGKILFSLHLDPSHPCYDVACILLYDRSLQFAIIQKNKKEILFTDFFILWCAVSYWEQPNKSHLENDNLL